jgi:hypothetical protein
MSNFQRMLTTQVKRLSADSFDSLMWAFPITLGLGWFMWPALDYEWKMEMGFAPDPEAAINKVHNAKLARMEALKIAKGGSISSGALQDAVAEKDDDEEEEEATEEETEEESSVDDGDDDVPAAEDGDAEEEEEEEIKFKPLFVPTKAEKLGPKEIWDNFTIKALNVSEDDDDDDEEGTYARGCYRCRLSLAGALKFVVVYSDSTLITLDFSVIVLNYRRRGGRRRE